MNQRMRRELPVIQDVAECYEWVRGELASPDLKTHTRDVLVQVARVLRRALRALRRK